MGLGRWTRHLRALAAASLSGDRGAALVERRELALLALDGDARLLTFERDGLVWTTTAVRHTITRNLFVRGRHPGSELGAFRDWLTAHGRLDDRHPWCADVGANVGAPTLFFARDFGRRVLAIEPVPENFELLRTNVAANACGSAVVCENAAVAAAAGVVRMERAEKDGQSEVLAAGATGRSTVDVPALPLAQILARHQVAADSVSFVWSDTQGFETEVLRSAPELWAAGVPAFVETWPEALERHGGLDAFVEVCASSFGGFIPKQELAAKGAAARPRTISELGPFLRSLRKQTDCLLVPASV